MADGVLVEAFEATGEGNEILAFLPTAPMQGTLQSLDEAPAGPLPDVCAPEHHFVATASEIYAEDEYELHPAVPVIGFAFRMSSAPQSGFSFSVTGNDESTYKQWRFAGSGVKVALFVDGEVHGLSVTDPVAWPDQTIDRLVWSPLVEDSEELCLTDLYLLVRYPSLAGQ